jgi:hypothetical protein
MLFVINRVSLARIRITAGFGVLPPEIPAAFRGERPVLISPLISPQRRRVRRVGEFFKIFYFVYFVNFVTFAVKFLSSPN